MKYEEYVGALNNLYETFYCNDGNCKFYDKCKENMSENGYRFCKAKVGKKYGQSNDPKIMFIGKEGVSNSNGIEEPANISEVPKNNRHYFGTIYTCALLLKGEISNPINQKNLLKHEELRHKFCLTNYYKCAFTDLINSRRSVSENAFMKKTCKDILIGEIKALRPNIIIVQGKFSHKSFYNEDGLLSFCNAISTQKFGSAKSEFTEYKYNDDNSSLYVVWGYHPCARGNKWLDGYNEVLCSIRNKFLNN